MTSSRSMVLRTAFVAALAAATLGSGAAFAQSQQGGYLGQSVGAHQTASAAAPRPAELGSGQGGYLGLNAGAHQSPAEQSRGDMRSSPAAWCRAASVEPGRCASRAMYDHAYCMQKDADHYASCRRAMDYIGWHN